MCALFRALRYQVTRTVGRAAILTVQGVAQKDSAELRASLIERFPVVPVHKVDEIMAAHSLDEDTCIAHLMATAYNEVSSSENGGVSTSSLAEIYTIACSTVSR